jgi:uncharacterized protein YprB with RNaseH-like and TPR domain
MKEEPKILFFDLETAGVNALRSDLGFVVCFGYKWAHEDKVHCLTIDLGRTKDKFSDRELLKQASAIFEQADLVVAHFGSVFDRRFLQGRLLINELPPIPQTKMRDTCFMARSIANFSSNRLKHLANILDLKNKKQDKDRDDDAPWPGAWFKVLAGDQKALQGMAKYCKQDVLVLEELYDRLKTFDNNHPRLHDDRSRCGLCGGPVEYRGYSYQLTNKYRRYVCKACKKWGRETNAVKAQALGKAA